MAKNCEKCNSVHVNLTENCTLGLYNIGRIIMLCFFEVLNKPQHCSFTLHLLQEGRYVCFQLEMERQEYFHNC